MKKSDIFLTKLTLGLEKMEPETELDAPSWFYKDVR